MGCSLPASSVHGIFQARILELVAISSSRGSSQPRVRTHVSCISCFGRRVLYHWAMWEALLLLLGYKRIWLQPVQMLSLLLLLGLISRKPLCSEILLGEARKWGWPSRNGGHPLNIPEATKSLSNHMSELGIGSSAEPSEEAVCNPYQHFPCKLVRNQKQRTQLHCRAMETSPFSIESHPFKTNKQTNKQKQHRVYTTYTIFLGNVNICIVMSLLLQK